MKPSVLITGPAMDFFCTKLIVLERQKPRFYFGCGTADGYRNKTISKQMCCQFFLFMLLVEGPVNLFVELVENIVCTIVLYYLVSPYIFDEICF